MSEESPSKVRNDDPKDSLLAIQKYSPNAGSIDPTNRDQYETTDIPQHQCSRSLRDPDGAYYASQPLDTNFQEDWSHFADFGSDDSAPMPMPMADDSESSRLSYVDSKMSNQTCSPGTIQYYTNTQSLVSRPLAYDEDYIVQNKNDPDLFYKKIFSDPYFVYNAPSSELPSRTKTTTESDNLCVGRAYKQYDTYYSDATLLNEKRRLECERDREHRFDRRNTASSSVSGTSLSVYEMLLMKKCQDEMGTEQMTQQTIEITPGLFVRFRGAVETWKAIHDDFYLPCTCICCNLTLFCIQDAAYVLCPACFNVSPIENVENCNGGMGLGFTMDELLKWQKEIIMNNRFVDGITR